MCVIKKIFLNQFFKISCLHLFFQEFKCRNCLHMDKWFRLIIQPAVKQLQSIHQSTRIISEICLTETELMIVDSGTECFLIDSIFHNVFQCVFNHTNEFFLLLYIRILRNYREDRLTNSIVIRSGNILSNTCIQKCFLQRCSRCGQKCIIQNLKCKIQLLIQCRTDHFIIRKICVVLLTLFTCDGILLNHFLHLCKWLLQMNL